MADTSTVSRPYAIAAFKQACEENAVAQWSDMLAFLEQVVADPTMKGVIASPKIDEQQLAALIIDVAGDRVSDTGRNFVRLLSEYGRLENLAEIREIFEDERARLEGRVEVLVTSAFELDDSQRNSIAATMAGRLGKQVDLEVAIDQSLIGGVIIKSGDTVIDASLRGRLAELGRTLL